MSWQNSAMYSANQVNPKSSSGFGGAQDYAQIISGAGQGASSALQGTSVYANSKREAKEARRRTLANLLSSAMRRNQNVFKMGQEHQDEMRDFQSQALQEIARGFVQALQR